MKREKATQQPPGKQKLNPEGQQVPLPCRLRHQGAPPSSTGFRSCIALRPVSPFPSGRGPCSATGNGFLWAGWVEPLGTGFFLIQNRGYPQRGAPDARWVGPGRTQLKKGGPGDPKKGGPKKLCRAE